MGKKILLADDSITIQKVIELTFSDEDFEVVTVGNGRLAIERVQEVRPDFVLCDIIMPEKDGYQVCEFIKKTPALSHIPVLLLTGAFEPFDQDKANRVGASGFLAKPFEPQSLIKKVKDLLAQAPAAAAAAPAVAAPAAPPAPPVPAPAAPVAPAAAAAPPAPPEAPPPPAAVTAPEALPDEAFAIEEEVAEAPPPPPASVEPDEGFVVEPTEEAAAEAAAPTEEAVFDEVPGGWAQPTAEVPLETRAQAGREASVPSPRVFDDVFEEATPEPQQPDEPELVSALPESETAAATLETGDEVFAPEPAAESMEPAAPASDASFADLGGGSEEAAAEAASEAAEVTVSRDMVEKIAQRVVGQVSEKVVREIAWEVVPELAEALIKKEIERLKAELEKL